MHRRSAMMRVVMSRDRQEATNRLARLSRSPSFPPRRASVQRARACTHAAESIRVRQPGHQGQR